MADDLVLIRLQLTGAGEVEAEATRASAAIKGISATADEATASTAATTGGIASSLKQHGSAMAAFGSTMTRYVSLPLAAVGIASGVLASRFERSMSLISTQAGGTAREVKHLEGQVLELAAHSKFSPDELSEGLYHIESDGYRGAKAMTMLREAQDLALVGNSNLEKTTYAYTSALKTGIEGTENYTKAAGEMNAIVGHGDIRMEEFAASLSTGILPKAKAVGLSLRDVGAMMDVLTARGVPAQRASYALGMTLQKLIPYSKTAEEDFAKIGLGKYSVIDAAKGPGGIVAGLELLEQHLKLLGGSKKQISYIEEMFGGGRMSTGILTNLQNLSELKQKYSELAKGEGELPKDVHEAEEQSLVKLQIAWHSIEASLIELGKVILPVLVPLVKTLAEGVSTLAEGFSKLPAPFKTAILAFSGLLIVGGPTLIFFGKIAQAIGILVGSSLFTWLKGLMGFGPKAAGALATSEPEIAASGTTLGTAFGAAFSVAAAGLIGFMIGKVLAEHMNSIESSILGKHYGADTNVAAQNRRERHGYTTAELRHMGIHRREIERQHRDEHSGLTHKSAGWFKKHYNLPGHAAGAESFGGGLAMVGEQGPELMYLPPGVDIMPNGPTRRWQEENPAAPGRLGDHRPRQQRRLLPIVLKLDSKTIAEVMVQTHQDAEARA